ncbi:putative alpha/Beta hydrolase [Rosa chinensis]|uniref:Putative alpha/Beta hydrolase n=1 Tax=Rosa chinensis TaxID=74649 RepID=A0A2P6Q0C0_ROSCH|nr:uncharacterized protein LOC112170469 isoform X1 [Rosa chinensis]PRQ27622.1 putative alpha/Beta hydrolase [Rosa chinensis]
MMLRLCHRTRRYCYHLFPHHHRHPRPLSSSASRNPIEPPNNLKNANQVPPPPPILHRRSSPIFPVPTASLSRNTVLGLTAAIASVAIASYAVVAVTDSDDKSFNPLYDGVQGLARQSAESCRRIIHHAKQTGVTASVLWHSLRSVLSSANHEVRSGFQLRVAALLADISAANASRRAAIVGAGGGAVVDWLLESVAVPRDGSRTQAESARALAFLIADPNVSAAVLGRPNAVPNLLRFIYSCQPKQSNKHSRRSLLDVSDSLRGRSMLVAAIMDIVTSNCDSSEKMSFKPSLPGDAETRDIAAALQVIEEGGMRLDDSNEHEGDEDGDSGIKGIGIKVLGGTSVLGLSRTSGLMELRNSDSSGVESVRVTNQNLLLQSKHDSSLAQTNLSSAVVPGLWDDLTCQHVAVPFAAWALANWAMASDENRSRIQELDADGNAVMTALMAPERSVKWHGSLVARLLLEDDKLPLNGSVSDWSSSLLSTASQATKNKDIPLAKVALSAFLVSVEKCPEARKRVMEKGLHLIRDTAKRTTKHKHVQEALAKALELLCTGDLHLSLQEGQKWSGVLLPWVFGQSSSDTMRVSAIKILSRILDDYGPYSVPISQGWLAILLTEILGSSKASSVKGNTQPKSDKVKTQIDQSNILSAAQTANQLVAAVVNLAVKQLGTTPDSVDTSPLADLLSMEPFSAPLKTLKKDSVPKVDVADSAMATLKGIKALTEVCSADSLCQEKIVDFGVLCLLRRFLLRDDYEKLSAIEAYDASKTLEAQDRTSNIPKESSTSDSNDPSSVRVPPTAHMRRHAARLLTILSLLPKVQKVIIKDEAWCKWLEDCANGKISGCSDLKIQSYARATLLNIFCNRPIDRDSANGDTPDAGTANINKSSPRYGDNIFLINPELSHWKCPEKVDQDAAHQDSSSLDGANPIDSEDKSVTRLSDDVNSSSSGDASHSGTGKREPPHLDIIFVHGLRGGPYKTWRIAEDKSSTKSGLVEKIDQEAGKLGTFWPGEWLSADFPQARMFTLRYKSSLTQWSGASLPLQEVSSMLLEKIVAAGIGDRPVVFVTHSMGGLVVKQILSKAKSENINNLVNNTVGIVFYSCPHFGSKLADMPWKMGFVLRPAPTIGELTSGSPRLVQLNDYIRHLHKKGLLQVLSFCETKVTPIVEGYGGWAFRMEIVPIESAYPGFGELVVLESTDHINSCKPLSRSDPSYTEILEFLRKLKTSSEKQTAA